jgi:hypothetical protein
MLYIHFCLEQGFCELQFPFCYFDDFFDQAGTDFVLNFLDSGDMSIGGPEERGGQLTAPELIGAPSPIRCRSVGHCSSDAH